MVALVPLLIDFVRSFEPDVYVGEEGSLGCCIGLVLISLPVLLLRLVHKFHREGPADESLRSPLLTLFVYYFTLSVSLRLLLRRVRLQESDTTGAGKDWRASLMKGMVMVINLARVVDLCLFFLVCFPGAYLLAMLMSACCYFL